MTIPTGHCGLIVGLLTQGLCRPQLVALGEMRVGAKWDLGASSPWAEPPTLLQPKPLLRCCEGTKHQGADTVLGIYGFLGFIMMLN